MRERKPETIIRELKRNLLRVSRERLQYHDEAYALRGRCQRVEQDCAEWKARFDTILLVLTQDARDKMAGQPGVFGGKP